MTLLTMRTAVRTRLGVPASDALYSDQNLTDLINSALQYIATEGDWSWLETSETIATVSGTTNYAVNASAMRTIAVIDPTGVPLKRLPFDELQYQTTATGASCRFYAPQANKIHVRPVPNAAFNLVHWYTTIEPALSADGDLPLMPSQWADAIVECACWLATMRSGDVTEAETRYGLYRAWITKMTDRADRDADSRGGGAPPGSPPRAPQAPPPG